MSSYFDLKNLLPNPSTKAYILARQQSPSIGWQLQH